MRALVACFVLSACSLSSRAETAQADFGVTVIADTQEHESRGAPDADLSRMADAYVRVTLRPAQQTLFAKEVLRSVLTNTSDPRNIVHLGDALDLSCRSEWQRFIETMSSTDRPWVLAPGNHDGFAFGNKLPTRAGFERKFVDVSRGGWDSLCDKGRYWPKDGQSFDKNSFVREYIRNVATRFPELGALDPSQTKFQACFARSRFLKCIAWNIDAREPWRSFISQLVEVTTATDDQPVYLVLLDTSNFLEMPSWAGTTASVLDEQFLAARSMMAALQLPQMQNVVYAGHHPLEEWDSASRRRLVTHIKETGTLRFYVSAHTHKGWWKDAAAVPSASESINELNVGSLNDAPVHYRTLQFESTSRQLIVTAERKLLEPKSEACRSIELPTDRRRPDSLEFQQPASAGIAFLGYPAYWRSKRRELAAELFLMEALIASHVPPVSATKFQYRWEEDERNQRMFNRRDDVLHEARYLQEKWETNDHARRIARFLIEADRYLNVSARDATELRRHQVCLSLLAAYKDAELGGDNVADLLKASEQRSKTLVRLETTNHEG